MFLNVQYYFLRFLYVVFVFFLVQVDQNWSYYIFIIKFHSLLLSPLLLSFLFTASCSFIDLGPANSTKVIAWCKWLFKTFDMDLMKSIAVKLHHLFSIIESSQANVTVNVTLKSIYILIPNYPSSMESFMFIVQMMNHYIVLFIIFSLLFFFFL